MIHLIMKIIKRMIVIFLIILKFILIFLSSSIFVKHITNIDENKNEINIVYLIRVNPDNIINKKLTITI